MKIAGKPRRWPLLALFLAAGCGNGVQVSSVPVEERGSPRPAERQSTSLWEAVENLDLDYRLAGSEPAEGRVLLDGLRLTYLGEPAGAEEAFGGLCRDAEDTEVGAAACRAFGALLLGRFAWEEIEQLTRQAPDRARASGMENLALVFGGPLLSVPPETQRWDAQPAIVETRRSRWGTPMIRVEVEGSPFWFWLDTGATLSVLTTEAARQAGVEPRGNRTGLGPTATQRQIAMRPGVVSELRLGSLVIRNHPVAIVDAKDLEVDPGGDAASRIDGIIGWPVFRRLSVEIDLAAGTTTLSRPESSGGVEPNLFWLGYPMVVTAAQSGESLLMGLDTGAAKTSLLPHAGTKIGLQASGRRRTRRWGAGGGEIEEVLGLSDFTLTVDGARFRFPAISMRPEGVRAPVLASPDGKLGSDLLEETRMVIDVTHGILLCEPN